MPQLNWKNLVGQQKVKDVLGAAFEKGTLAHAYLFCGEEGTGKLQAAIELSLGLLCSSKNRVPCYNCESCQKVLHFAHPDFRFIFPVYLQGDQKSKDGKISEKGWDFIAKESCQRVNSPYKSSVHKGIPNIPVEWIRDVNHAILRGTIEGKMSITIIDSADMLSKDSANAMLKILEEPPDNTLMILLTDRHHAVLQTIVSRCQNLRFGYLSREQISETLTALCPEDTSEQDVDDAAKFALGSLGRALYLLENPTSEWAEQASELVDLCSREDWTGIADAIDDLSARDNYLGCEQVLIHYVYLIRERVLQRNGCPEKYINTKLQSHDDPLNDLDPYRADDLFQSCQRAISAIKARGNTALILVNFIMSMMEIFNGKKR